MQTPGSSVPRHRGIAMMLVVMAVAVAVTLSAVFLSEQTISAQMSRNIVNAAEARQIADSGLQMTIVYIQATSNWRTIKSPGNWVVNQSFAGGTFAVNARDGWDSNGDGVISMPAEGNADFSNATHAVTLTVTGSYKGSSWKAMAVLTPKAGSGGTICNGIVSSGSIIMSTGSTIDSFDSSKGGYGGSNVGTNSHVVTDLTTAGAVSLGTGAKLAGNVAVAPGGNPANTVSVGTGGTYTGTTTAMAKSMAMPTVTVPNLGATGGAFSVATGGSATISSSMHVSSLSVGTGGTLKISGNVVIVSEGNVSVGTGGNLEVLNGATLTLYCKGALAFSTGADNKADGANLSALAIYNLSTTPVQLSTGGALYGVLISPNAGVVASTGFRLYGAVMATSLTLGTGCAFHEDTDITSGGDPVQIPGTPTTYATRWLNTF